MTRRRMVTAAALAVVLIVIVLVVISFGGREPDATQPGFDDSTSTSSMVTTSTLDEATTTTIDPSEAVCTSIVAPGDADVATLIRTAADGSVICLRDGAYGALIVDAQRDGLVTLRSVHPRGAVFSSIQIDDASYLRFEQLTVQGLVRNGNDNSHHIEIAGSDLRGVEVYAPSTSASEAGPGPVAWVIEFNDIHDCTAFCVGLFSDDPARYWPVSDVVVEGNKLGPMAGGVDAIRAHNFRDISILDNEIFGVIEDGQHNDCFQSVWGGDGLVFAGNYLHDNNCQTFFIKDGYVQNVLFEDNLSLRNRAGSASVVGQVFPTGGFTMRNNTLWDGSGLMLRSEGHGDPFSDGPAEDYLATNNVIDFWIPYDDAVEAAGVFTDPDLLTEDNNVFGGGWTWVPRNLGPHSIEDSTPSFIRTSSSANEDAAVGDWRLSGPVTAGGATYSAGITWELAGRVFGVAAFDSGSRQTG